MGSRTIHNLDTIDKCKIYIKELEQELDDVESEVLKSPLCDDMDTLQEMCPIIYNLIDGDSFK